MKVGEKNENLRPMTRRANKIDIAVLVFVFVLTVLLVVPFAPHLPAADFDSSWQYAMNVAAARHLIFGRDIVLTVGPMASVYTHQYHPETDGVMLVVSFAMAIALFVGFAALTTPSRRGWLLLLPLFLGLQLLLDAQFMILPLLLVYFAGRRVASRSGNDLVLLFVGMCCALLPYVKRNLTLLAFVGTVFVAAMLWRKRRRLVTLLIVIQVATLVLGWLAAGQQLSALPQYFISQSGIISGYTDAMAIGSDFGEVVAYIAIALLMICLTLHDEARRAWYLPVFLALTLFVCFKMGFVRQDLHESIAATALGLVGLTLFLCSDSRIAYVFLIGGLSGWAIVAAGHEDIQPSAVAHRFSRQIATSANGAWTRIVHPESLPRAFIGANERLALTAPLPVYPGSSDLYSSNIADLFANGANWQPRPIVQSTSAYTPALLALNLSHLQNDPPEHIYFRPSPVDNRYPAFEDGVSWPQLLRDFEPLSMAGDYAVLGRRNAMVDVEVRKPLLSTAMTLGKVMSIPVNEGPLWATIEIEPTLLGRIASLLYRLPPLHMTLTYSDQSIGNYRFVPGVASAGFLLSPTVMHAEDFVALASPQNERFFAGRRPLSLAIDASGGAGWLWRPTYHLTLSSLVVPVDPRVDALLLSRHVSVSALLERIPGGDCVFDAINEKPVDENVQDVPPSIVRIRGWAMLSARQGRENAGVVVELEDDAGTIHWLQATQYPRVDVAMYFGLPYIPRSGYEVVFDTQYMRGNYTLRVLQSDGSKQVICGNSLHIHVTNPTSQARS